MQNLLELQCLVDNLVDFSELLMFIINAYIEHVPHFYCKQMSRFVFRHLTLTKSLKRFITEYIPDVRTIISET